MRVTKIEHDKGARRYTNRSKINSSIKDELEELIGFYPVNVGDLLDRLHLHDNFLCGANNQVMFQGNVIKKIFKCRGDIYFLTGDRDNPYHEIFFKIEK